MCFISFGSISGSINASNGTIFDVYQVEIILITKYVPSFRYILRSKYRKCTFFSFCVLYILVDDSCRMVRTLFCQ